MKSSDVQPGPGMVTIFSSDGGSGVGFGEACGYEAKNYAILFLERWSSAVFLEPEVCLHICML